MNYSQLGLNVWGKMKDRLERLQDEQEAAIFGGGTMTNGTPSVSPSLTMADIEKALHDIDPDGRHLQEARLLAVCAKLTKEQVDQLIWCAELMVTQPLDLAISMPKIRPADKGENE